MQALGEVAARGPHLLKDVGHSTVAVCDEEADRVTTSEERLTDLDDQLGYVASRE
jgi:hypothetical protein